MNSSWHHRLIIFCVLLRYRRQTCLCVCMCTPWNRCNTFAFSIISNQTYCHSVIAALYREIYICFSYFRPFLFRRRWVCCFYKSTVNTLRQPAIALASLSVERDRHLRTRAVYKYIRWFQWQFRHCGLRSSYTVVVTWRSGKFLGTVLVLPDYSRW